ncbi:MAG: M23 family peptidase, partial [Thauera sp.]|nr:M23 family peptidase [Thauera sp.]
MKPARLRVRLRRTLLSSFFVCAAGVVAVPAVAIDLPRARSVPGGVLLVELGAASARPSVTLDDQPVLVVADEDKGRDRWMAVVGLALDSPTGARELVVRREGVADERRSFVVEPVRYAEQRLKVAPGKVDLSAEDLARYERERAHLAEVAATRSEAAPATLRLQQPTAGRRSSSFGLRRIFNDQPR